MTEAMHIAVKSVRTNGGTQSRAAINDDVVADYADAIRDGTEFPRIKLFFDGTDYWLADGFHRLAAYARAGRDKVPAEIEQGTRREAILYSVGANANHGLRRTNDDKRRAVMTLLKDPEWSTWSANHIAKQCGVSHTFVNGLKSSLETNSSEPRTFTNKHGTTSTMDTSSIGKPAAHQEPVSADPEQAVEQPHEKDQTEPAAPVEPQTADEPEPIRDPYGYAKLTEEALLETANGLREQYDELSRRVTKQTGMIADLKGQIKELTSGEDAGRKIGNLQRRLTQSEGRSKEHQANAARLQRQANAQKPEIAQLRKSLENQEIAL